MTSAPAKSPIHHVAHIDGNSAQSAYSAKLKLPTPKVALIMVARRQISVNLATRAGVSNVLRPPDHRFSRYAPARLSSVFPVAIARDVPIDPAVVALAMRAPKNIAGETRYPRSNMAPRAYPVGGHIGVALGWIEAKAKLSFAKPT
jgi:hypothetical protein